MERIARQVHTIRGASENIGGDALYALCGELERAANAGRLEAVRGRLNELEKTFETLRYAIQGDMP